jgi:hypothetical protein
MHEPTYQSQGYVILAFEQESWPRDALSEVYNIFRSPTIQNVGNKTLKYVTSISELKIHNHYNFLYDGTNICSFQTPLNK